MTQSPTDPTRNTASPAPQAPEDAGLDAAQQSLSDALRVSFTVLKVLMVALLVVYLCSGIFRVAEQQTAVRYQLGERVGVYGPGWHFGLPFPIEEKIMVPQTTQTVKIDQSFWYDNPEGKSPEQLASQPLDPIKDGFLITGDGNVVHVNFDVVYQISAEQVDIENYLRNVGSLERANVLVQTAAERGMIHAVSTARTESIIKGSIKADDVLRFTQQVLDELQSGINVQQVVIEKKNQSMPNQVRSAYEEVSKAQADKVRAIQEARRSFDETLGRTAGGAHTQLLEMVRAYEAALGNEQDELAQALRGELNRSLRELRLPEPALLGQVRAYQSAVTDAAGSEDAQKTQAAAEASKVLAQALASLPEERELGRPIAGEIATSISRARANRSEISTQARLDYERYASALEAYRKTPMVLVNDRLQSTREAVMSGLVQNIVGPIGRIDTNADPEVQEEIAEAELQRRREKAAQEKAKEGR